MYLQKEIKVPKYTKKIRNTNDTVEPFLMIKIPVNENPQPYIDRYLFY